MERSFNWSRIITKTVSWMQRKHLSTSGKNLCQPYTWLLSECWYDSRVFLVKKGWYADCWSFNKQVLWISDKSGYFCIVVRNSFRRHHVWFVWQILRYARLQYIWSHIRLHPFLLLLHLVTVSGRERNLVFPVSSFSSQRQQIAQADRRNTCLQRGWTREKIYMFCNWVWLS